VTGAERLNIDNTWLQQTVLHEMSFSIPSARYADKADGIVKKPARESRRKFCMVMQLL
jgi:hypothetical protein